MKTINYDKLQDAMETVKGVCEDYIEDEGCSNCPLGNKDGFCKLCTPPVKWQARHPATDAFRVLE